MSKAVENAVATVVAELEKARRKHSPMHSAHEGYAVILEELDEVWAEVKRDNLPAARKEMIQVAAMALRFLVDLPDPTAEKEPEPIICDKCRKPIEGDYVSDGIGAICMNCD
jgi:hypothetical protein